MPPRAEIWKYHTRHTTILPTSECQSLDSPRQLPSSNYPCRTGANIPYIWRSIANVGHRQRKRSIARSEDVAIEQDEVLEQVAEAQRGPYQRDGRVRERQKRNDDTEDGHKACNHGSGA